MYRESFTIFSVQMCAKRNGGIMRSKLVDKLKVAQFTKEGVLIKIWDTQKEASEVTGIRQQSISLCCHSKIKTAGGFRWCFI